MAHGKFPKRVANQDRRTLRNDNYALLRLMRGRRGEEEMIKAFQGRVSGTSSGSLGRDHQRDVASTSSQSCVIAAPPWLDVKRGDEVWTTEDVRYRVTAVDNYPGQRQIIAELLQ